MKLHLHGYTGGEKMGWFSKSHERKYTKHSHATWE